MRGVGNLLSFLVVVPLTRMSARGTLGAGMLIQAGAGLWMGQLDMNMSTEDVMWTNLIHGFGFGLAYTPMAALAFSTLGGAYLTQGNAIFSLMRMMGSSLFIAIMLVVLVQSSSVAEVNLASTIYASPDGLLRPWLDQFGGVNTSPFQLFATNEIRQQATMIGYINTFHLLTLVPAAVAPLVLLFTKPKT